MAHDLGQIFLEKIADSQCGVVSLRDALAAGVTPAQVRWRVANGQWQRPMRDVLLLRSDPPDRLQLLWCAVESVGPDAYLAGASAATLDGLRGYDNLPLPPELPLLPEQKGRGEHDGPSEPAHLPGPSQPPRQRPSQQSCHGHCASIAIVVASDRRVTPRQGLTVRRTARLDPSDVARDELPRRTQPARSLIDLAEWATGRDEARAALAAAVQQRVVTPDQLRDALSRRGPITRRTLVADTIDELEAAADAVVDVLYERMEVQFGLPAGRRRLTTAFGGSARRLNVSYDRWNVHVQVDNGTVADLPGTDVTGRRLVLRFTSRLLRESPGLVAGQVRDVLRDQGFPA